MVAVHRLATLNTSYCKRALDNITVYCNRIVIFDLLVYPVNEKKVHGLRPS